MNGFFGDMFDFNQDGKLDGFERVADFAMFTSLMEDEEDIYIYAAHSRVICSFLQTGGIHRAA